MYRRHCICVLINVKKMDQCGFPAKTVTAKKRTLKNHKKKSNKKNEIYKEGLVSLESVRFF